MAFLKDGSNKVISFAEFTDVVQKDQRIFESNNLKIPAQSGFLTTEDFVEDMLQKSTNRLALKIKASTWWASYNYYVGNSFDPNDRPNVDLDKIDPNNTLGRQQQFTDMCVYYCFAEYLFPLFAEFGNDDSPEVAKITYYTNKYNDLFNELLAIADWYDNDGDGTVEATEKATSFSKTRRTRTRPTIVQVR